MTSPPNTLATTLRAFFGDHLPTIRGVSPHTIRSYRDSVALLLRFLASSPSGPSRRSTSQISPWSTSWRFCTTWSSSAA